MSDRPTLTGVMLGIDKHGLVDRLTEQCFTFLIGLILEANRLRFKNPFDLTLNQTMAAGGGDSRQTVSRRRRQLSKYKIDGKPIMTYTAGNKSRNTTATYTIDYDLLCSYNGVWQGQTDTPSQMWDRSATEVRREADSSATILRSDQKRGDQDPPTPPNIVTTHLSSENEEVGVGSDSLDEDDTKTKKALRVQELIFQKWGTQIKKKPDYGACKKALREFDWDYTLLLHCITKGPQTLNSPRPESALALVVTMARGIQNAGNGKATPAMIEERKREILQLETDLEEARKKPEENEGYISQHEHLLGLKMASLESLRR